MDDESRILDGLKRMLRSMRNEWDIRYANSAEEALQILEKNAYDVIVSDVRMPAMDGIQLLMRIQKLYPHMVRIVLSGYSDNEYVMKSTKVAHQYLSKPCNAETIKTTIQRACNLKETLENPEIQQLISKMDTLPSLPEMYNQIINELESPEPSVNKVGEIISQDLAMSAKILQIVNSAFFGIPRHIESPNQAVHLLGLQMVRSLVLYVQIFNLFKEEDVDGFSLSKLWNHSFRVQDFTKVICQTEGISKRMRDHAVIAGLLHDIGILILIANYYQDYKEILKIVKKEKRPLYQIENEKLNVNHALVGAYLLGIWGLPNETIEAVVYHHQPAMMSKTEFNHISAVYAANIIDSYFNPNPSNEQGSEFSSIYPNNPISKEKFNLWLEKCRTQLNNHQEL